MSDLYALGQPVRLSTVVTDIDGIATDPDGLSISYEQLGGSVTTVTYPTGIVRESAGTYHYDLTPAAAGHYRYSWVSTGTAAGVGPNPGPGVFTVIDPFADGNVRLVSLADAKAFIGFKGSDAGQLALLDRIVGWASARILQEVAAVPTTYTQVATARDGELTLYHTPVRSVTSATPLDSWTSTLTVSDLAVYNPLYGVVRSKTGLAPCGTYAVVYEAGHDTIPPGVDGACLSLVLHWWNQSQAHGSSTYGDAGFVPDFTSLPNVVTNMLASVARPLLIA